MSVFSYGTAFTASTNTPPTRNSIKTQLIKSLHKEKKLAIKRQEVNIILDCLITHNIRKDYNDLVNTLRDTELEDQEMLSILSETRSCMEMLRQPRVHLFVECLLNLNWLDRIQLVVQEYQLFLLDLLVAQTNYSKRTISMLVSYFKLAFNPQEKTSKNYIHLNHVHNSINQILEIVPVTFKTVSQEIYHNFPYHNQPPVVFAAYISNLFWLLRYRPIFTEDIVSLLIKQFVTLDTRLPRDELEEQALQEDNEITVNQCEMMFDMEDDEKPQGIQPLVESLDISMEIMFQYLSDHFRTHPRSKMFDTLFNIFVDSLLLTYNSHHVQFVIFYYCSLKAEYAEQFIQRLWTRIGDFNETPLIRQASVDYLSSFLARAQFVPLSLLQQMLQEFCQFAHTYINRCDNAKNKSLKCHTVFFSICQAIFYLVAFRSKDLFSTKKNILFLQSLQLSQLVNCRLNPLLLCKPAIVTAFASITRTYQLAYCYTVMERNSRRRLAIIYTDETQMPEESLRSMFPFDPYLLKRSGEYITDIYQTYQSCHTEDVDEAEAVDGKPSRKQWCAEQSTAENMCMSVEDGDDFLMNQSRNKSILLENKFSYGSSPGFH